MPPAVAAVHSRYTMEMRKLLAWAATLILPVGLTVCAAEQSKPAAKKNPNAGSVKKNTARSSTTKKATPHGSTSMSQAKAANKTHTATANQNRPKPNGGKSAARGTKKPVKRTTWRNRQTAPTPERYKEIQSALAEKGYLPADAANGQWNESSVEALKKFQSDQHIESTGKLNSLSLIALGLGPKRDAAASTNPPASTTTNAISTAQPLN